MHEIQASGRNWRLLQIRNPWGSKGEWEGAWSDKSNLWTPDLRRRLGSTDANDGIFFMPLEDYLTHYRETSICVSVAENLAYSSAQYSEKRTVYYEFTLKNDHDHLALTVN